MGNKIGDFAEHSNNFVGLSHMQEHLEEAVCRLKPSDVGDMNVTLKIERPELDEQLAELYAELEKLQEKKMRKMGPMMVIGGEPDNREEKLEGRIAALREEMTVFNVTATLDPIYINQIMEILKTAVSEERRRTQEALVGSIFALNIMESKKSVAQ
jgi:hypothetical protein